MGMRDESWCNGCGTSVPYSDADETYCGDCAEEYGNERYENLIDMMKQHKEQMEEQLFEVEEFTETHDVLLGGIEALDYILTKAGAYTNGS